MEYDERLGSYNYRLEQAAKQGDIIIDEPHENQQIVHDSPARYKVILAGRRWGKTECGIHTIETQALMIPGMYWWVGLSWRAAAMKRAWRFLTDFAVLCWAAKYGTKSVNRREFINNVDKIIKLPNGSQIWQRSAENPDALVGDALHGVVMDEFPYMAEIVWEEKIRPACLDYRAWCIMIGTPNGEGWHSKIWRTAKDRPNWEQFHFTSYENPTIPHAAEELDEDRKTMPDAKFRQEYLAEIVDSAGTVFHRLKECIDPTIILPGQPQPGRYYVAGIDFARVEDFSVMAIWDVEAKALVHYSRFQLMDYPSQVQRFVQEYHIWDPQVMVCDAVGIGQAMVGHLRNENLPVQEFHSNQHTKPQMIENLRLDVEYGNVRLPDDDDLLQEFQAFSIEILPSGLSRYSAPEGYHDDIVIACCLGYTCINRGVLQIG